MIAIRLWEGNESVRAGSRSGGLPKPRMGMEVPFRSLMVEERLRGAMARVWEGGERRRTTIRPHIFFLVHPRSCTGCEGDRGMVG
jgi:hypothetical protein